MKGVKVSYLKWLKLTVAVPAAMAIAEALGLSYAYSAGIITLLTIQNTKKETFVLAAKRVLAFGLMTVLCIAIFQGFGHEIWTYALFLFAFIFVCMRFDLEGAVSMNAVLATHYLADTITLSSVKNESLLFIIGAGIGVTVNLFMPENLSKIRAAQKRIDDHMGRLLKDMGTHLLEEEKGRLLDRDFLLLDKYFFKMEREATLRIQNTLTKADTYFLRYMDMRMEQCKVLQWMYQNIKNIEMLPEQAGEIGRFLIETGESYHEKNNVEKLSENLDNLKQKYRESRLPKTREEFENRALLMQILRDLGVLLDLKRTFVEKLTEKEKEIYWEQ